MRVFMSQPPKVSSMKDRNAYNLHDHIPPGWTESGSIPRLPRFSMRRTHLSTPPPPPPPPPRPMPPPQASPRCTPLLRETTSTSRKSCCRLAPASAFDRALVARLGTSPRSRVTAPWPDSLLPPREKNRKVRAPQRAGSLERWVAQVFYISMSARICLYHVCGLFL